MIGVGPEDFLGASPMVYAADLWLPVSVDARVAPELAGNALERHDRAIFHFLGRLRPGVPAGRAEAALDAVAQRLDREYGVPDRDQPGRRVTLRPGGKLLPIPKQDLPILTSYLLVLGGMVLLIASFNVANMMLARAADRRREIAVRLALGAGRARLVRQLLTESMIVAAGAGIIGFLLSVWIMRLGSGITLPYPMPLHFDLQPDGRVLLFTLGLSAFTGLAFGLAPALQATRTDLTPALKEGGNVRLRRYRRLSLRNVLVLSQVAASLALLLITGFLVLGHRQMTGVEVGFDTRNLYVISLDPVRDGYSGAQAAAFFQKLLDRVKALPAIASASLGDSAPMQMMGKPTVPFSVDGRAVFSARQFVVGKEYFDTLGVPILRGRGFRKEDEADDAMAAVVSERLARDCWKGQDPLGRRIEIGSAGIARIQHRPDGLRAAAQHSGTDARVRSGGGRSQLPGRPRDDEGRCAAGDLSPHAPGRLRAPRIAGRDPHGALGAGGGRHRRRAARSLHAGRRSHPVQRPRHAGTDRADDVPGPHGALDVRLHRGVRADPGFGRPRGRDGVFRHPAPPGDRHSHRAGGPARRRAADWS